MALIWYYLISFLSLFGFFCLGTVQNQRCWPHRYQHKVVFGYICCVEISVETEDLGQCCHVGTR